MEKKNTGLIVMVIILSLLVVGLGGYIIYDMVIINNNNLKDNVIDNDESNQEVDIDNKVELNDNEICNTNKNVYYGDLDKNIISNSGFSYNYLLYNIKISNYYGTLEAIGNNKKINYSVYISLDDNLLNVCYNDNCEKINQLENVIQVVETYEAGDFSRIYYILLNNGDVYKYILNLDKSKNILNKIENVSNIRYIMSFHFSKENAGSSWGVFALTNNGKYIELFATSV